MGRRGAIGGLGARFLFNYYILSIQELLNLRLLESQATRAISQREEHPLDYV